MAVSKKTLGGIVLQLALFFYLSPVFYHFSLTEAFSGNFKPA